jgi:integrase
MSVYLRGRLYWIEVRDPAGNRIRESAGTDDLIKAQAYHDIRVQQLRLGHTKAPTWNDAVARWMSERSDKRSLDRDRQMADWLEKYWSDMTFGSITDDDIRAVVDKKRRETSASNANHYLKFIKALFNRSMEWKWVASNPVRMKPYKVNNRRVRFLSEQEYARLIGELPRHLAVMAEFSVLTGLRRSNVTGLKWSRVDLERRLLWVSSSDYKSGRDHGMPLSDRAVEILRGEQGQHPLYVFTYNGKPVTQVNTKAWRKALNRAGVSDFRWHDLRHTFASYHAMNGTPLLTLKALGGWQSLDMVNRYAHLSSEGSRLYVANSAVQASPGVCVGDVGNVGAKPGAPGDHQPAQLRVSS